MYTCVYCQSARELLRQGSAASLAHISLAATLASKSHALHFMSGWFEVFGIL